MKVKILIDKAKKTNSEHALFITCPYNADIVEVIRSFNDKWWHADQKVWEVATGNLPKLINRLSWCEFEISGVYVDLEQKKVELPDFNFKTKPFEHQIEGFNYGLNHNRWLLADEQGLGKTKQVIDIAIAKKQLDGIKHCLIICGVNGLKWNWLNEVSTHSNEQAMILGQRITRGKITVGGNKDKYTDLCKINDYTPFFLITNVESLRDKDIQDKIEELCKDKTIGMVAIDEIHKCKDPTSQQGKGILKAKADIRIAMTGTPLMNNPLDLYIILKWLGYENHSFYAFKNHLCEMGGYGGYEIIGYKQDAMNALQEQLDEIMLRRRKKDVLDLPDKIYVNEYVEMGTEQTRIYKEVTAEIREHIDQIAVSPNPLAQLIRLRQATGYAGILSSEVTESAKLDRMKEIVEESLQSGQKVVIFSNWTQITDEVYERLRKYKLARITGQTSDSDRQAQVDMFQNDPDCRIIIGTTGAMGTGLNLYAGTVEIFLDEPWNMALKEQCADRCHRIGQTKNITIYTLICKNTIDERVNEIVEKKGAMADAIIDGQIQMNKTDLLNYLVG